MRNVKNVLRGVRSFALFFAGFSLFLKLGERYYWVEPVYIGLVFAYLVVGSVIMLWRAAKYGDFAVTGQMFWLPRRWQVWMFPGIDKR